MLRWLWGCEDKRRAEEAALDLIVAGHGYTSSEIRYSYDTKELYSSPRFGVQVTGPGVHTLRFENLQGVGSACPVDALGYYGVHTEDFKQWPWGGRGLGEALHPIHTTKGYQICGDPSIRRVYLTFDARDGVRNELYKGRSTYLLHFRIHCAQPFTR